MLRIIYSLLIFTVVLGCRAPEPQVQGYPVGHHEEGAFALVVRGDTTVVDEYTRTASALEGLVRPQVDGSRFGWARYRVEFNPNSEAALAVLSLGRVGTSPDSAPVDSWVVTLRDGFLIEESPNQPTRRVRSGPGVVPFFPPSMAMFFEVVRQAHRLTGGHGEIQIPVYPLANGGATDTVNVAWIAPDTAEVRYRGAESRYVVDEQGRVLGGRTQGGEFITVRLGAQRDER